MKSSFLSLNTRQIELLSNSKREAHVHYSTHLATHRSVGDVWFDNDLNSQAILNSLNETVSVAFYGVSTYTSAQIKKIIEKLSIEVENTDPISLYAQMHTVQYQIVVISGIHNDEIAIEMYGNTTAVIIIEDNTLCRIRYSYSIKHSLLTNRVIVFLGEGANATVFHQQPHQLIQTIISYEYHLSHNASLDLSIKQYGSNDQKEHAAVFLKGDYAAAFVRASQDAIQTSKKMLTFKQIHQGYATRSSSLVHGVAREHGKIFFRSMVHIGTSALCADAQQLAKYFIMSSDARVRTLPALEVLNHQVKCKHGSAISFIDPEMIFYMQTRGINNYQAESLITESFLKQPLSISI